MANLSNINNKFLVTTGGNILIGQTSVVGSSILQVTGASSPLAIHTPSGNNGLEFIVDNGLYTNWQIGVQNQVGNALTIVPSTAAGNTTFSTPVATFLSSGNVGIGTTSPDGIFHVDGGGASIYSIFSKSDTKWMFLHTGGSNPSIGWDSAGDMRFGTSTSNVGAGFSERVRISSVGHLRVRNSEGWTAANNTEVIGHSALEVGPIRNGTNNALCVVAVAGNLAAVQGIDSVSNNVQRLPLNPFGGGVGIGVALSDGDLEVNTSTVVTGASHTVNNVLIGLQGADRPTIILDTANTTYTNRTWNITNNGSLGSLLIGRNGLDVLVMSNSGNVGIGNTTETNRKLSVSGITKTFGFVNTNNYMEKLINLPSFPNGTANLNVDIQFGNVSFWGYIELEITGTYSNQSTPGKLTKLYAIGTNPGIIYENESRVSDALGDIADNIALGDFRYDNTTGSETFAIKVSHIVSSGNSYTVKVKVFTHGNGASTVIDNLNYSSAYTETALARQYPYYHDRLGIGTTSPSAALTVKTESSITARFIGRSADGFSFLNFRNNADTATNGEIGISDAQNMLFYTGTTERMRITSGGKVGIDEDNPLAKLVVNQDSYADTEGLWVQSASNPGDGGVAIFKSASKVGTISSLGGDSSLSFMTNLSGTTSERMRITSEGYILLGTQGLPDGTSVYGSAFIPSSVNRTILSQASSSTAASTLQVYRNPNGMVGSISMTNSTTAYNTTSDYRLKEDLQGFAGLDMVSKIPVYDFKWKLDESRSYGVMAHELQEVLPDAVSGEKDAEEMQGVDYSKIVPLLVKSIQELKAEVDKLKQECKCKN